MFGLICGSDGLINLVVIPTAMKERHRVQRSKLHIIKEQTAVINNYRILYKL